MTNTDPYESSLVRSLGLTWVGRIRVPKFETFPPSIRSADFAIILDELCICGFKLSDEFSLLKTRKFLFNSFAEVTDKQLKSSEDFVWAIDIPLTGKLIIDVEFHDLKTISPEVVYSLSRSILYLVFE